MEGKGGQPKIWKGGGELEKYIVTKHFRCTKEEAQAIAEKAQKENKKISVYLRDAALCREIPRINPAVMEMLDTIRDNELKIGATINQIAQHCNAKGYLSGYDYQVLIDYLEKIMRQRKGMIDAIAKKST